MKCDASSVADEIEPVCESAASGGGPSAFWPAVLLSVALVGCKAVNLRIPEEWTLSGFRRCLWDLVIIAHEDVLFSLAVGLGGQTAIWLSSRWRRVQGILWGGVGGFGAVSVVYAVVSVKVFEYMRMPLTYPLLYLAGDVRNVSSSVGHFANPLVVGAAVGLPVLYVVLVWLTRRLVFRSNLARVGQMVGIAAILVLAGVAHRAVGVWGSSHAERRIVDSPHWALLASCLRELAGGHSVRLDEAYAPEDLEDFRVVREWRGSGFGPTAGLARAPRNVIVVIAESVGTQFLGMYGGKFATTPRLEAEAGSCLVFGNYYTHMTNTPNALVAMLLSTYPTMSWREWTVERPDLPGISLAQVLRDRGYRTAFISAGDNAFANQAGFLKGRGFDAVWDYRDCGSEPPPAWEFSWGVEDRRLVDMVLRWVDQEPDRQRPFMIVSWTQGTHHPYYAGPGHKEIEFFSTAEGKRLYGNMWWDLGRYLNALHEMDAQIGRLLDELRKRRLEEDTMVIIVGDHGEAFGVPHESYGHSGKVYQEDVNVPLILWSPALFKRPGRSEAIGAHVDLGPTVADLLGISLPASWQGRSLFDPSRPPRAYFYGAMDSYLYGVRQDQWKYIYNATLGRDELYDLGSDGQELVNVVGSHPELARRLRQRLAAWLDYQQKLKR